MATKPASTGIVTPAVLAFERKLSPSDAVFSQGTWGSTCTTPVTVVEKSVRGTISNRAAKKNADKETTAEDSASNANIQRVHSAALAPDCDTLKTEFTLRVLGGVGEASACGSPAYQQRLRELVLDYANKEGFGELAARYARNLVSGRSLWRNKFNADAVSVTVEVSEGGVRSPVARVEDCFDEAQLGAATAAVAAHIEAGLTGLRPVLLHITTFARIGAGQEVFPSQELVQKTKSDKEDIGKILYTVNGVAAQHSQKIGNAVRCIDTWYPSCDGANAIAVEPYGSVTNQGAAHRAPSTKADFYNLLDAWTEADKDPGEQRHYVMAVLVRGGVFGKAA